MPTSNPRVSITLAPSDLAILDRFAEASGTPRATVLAGLVSSVLPQLEKAAALMELANAAPRHVQQELAEGVRQATEAALGGLEEAHETYDDLMAKVQGDLPLEGKQGRRRVRRASAPASGAAGKGRGPRTPAY